MNGRQQQTALKLAIVASGRKQKRIAHLAHIAETDLSHIICGRRQATERQREKLAAVLETPEADLFPEIGGSE